MQRILVTNKTKNVKAFQTANGELELQPGDNFIHEDDLSLLKNGSAGFAHFIETKGFVIRKESRDETETETKQRKTITQKALALFQRPVPKSSVNNAQIGGHPSPTEEDAEKLKEALLLELTKEKNKEVESFQAKITTLHTHMEEKLKNLEKSFQETTLLSLDKLSMSVDELLKEKLEKLLGDVDVKLTDLVIAAEKSMDDKLKSKAEAFEKVLQEASQKSLAAFQKATKSKSGKLTG